MQRYLQTSNLKSQTSNLKPNTENMESDNNIYGIASDFAIRIVKLYKYLTEQKKEFVMSKQLFRSGTSIGANAFEGKNAYS